MSCLLAYVRIGFAILKCIEDLVPPIECGGDVDAQGLGQILEGGTRIHEPDVLQPDFLGEMASYPYGPFLFSKGPAAIHTDEPLVTCRGLPILADVGTSTMGATGLLFLGCLGRLW